MPDTVAAETRSRMMSRIRGRNTSPELAVRRFLHGHGFRYRLHVRTLQGTPDIVLARYRTAIFVNGCFWHRHPGCQFAYMPKSRVEFWEAKFHSTVVRDDRARAELQTRKWTVLTVWECETNEANLRQLADLLRRRLGAGPYD